MKNRDQLVSFINGMPNSLRYPPKDMFREGFRAVPKGVSSFLFLTRNSEDCRKEEAFLFFDDRNMHGSEHITAKTDLGTEFKIEKSALIPTLRTPVGIHTMDITTHPDYVAIVPYKSLESVITASGFRKPERFNWKEFWSRVSRDIRQAKTHVVVSRRLNPYSPNSNLLGFYSSTKLSPTNQLNVIEGLSIEQAKAFCVIINSIIFLSQFFLLKEETTGRYIDIRFYDLSQMIILPNTDNGNKLSKIFDEYAGQIFPSLRDQLDVEFDLRYNTFWLMNKKSQKTLFDMNEIVSPLPVRLAFDKEVCHTLGLKLSDDSILQLYTIIINEMIVTRGLTKD